MGFIPFSSPYGREVVREAMERQPELWCWLISNMIVVPHAAAVFATFVRWGALPLGICCGIASFFMTMGIIIATTFTMRSNELQTAVFYVICMLILAACALSHLVVWRRMMTISSQ